MRYYFSVEIGLFVDKGRGHRQQGGFGRLPLPLWTKLRDIEKPLPSSSASPIAARKVALASDPLNEARRFALVLARRCARC